MSRQASGLKAWFFQRITAIYIAVYFLVSVVWLLTQDVLSHNAWQKALSGNLASICFLLFVLSILFHSWVGIRDVVMDYVKPVVIRVGLLTVIGVELVICLIWAALLVF